MKLFQNWLVSDIGATKQLFPKWKKNNHSRNSIVLIRCIKRYIPKYCILNQINSNIEHWPETK